ncbi:hypothetical protein PanWU01x14_263700 [Parasponia andersonii]|uniref:Uncharacterized protein n=1 Tax=Parasponia andersonii TaxID=3476 RepID=A0A2P5B7W1_PARAD|nr:hypothetical protein PanWU01x14_263700 [Parasponia andersonii]
MTTRSTRPGTEGSSREERPDLGQKLDQVLAALAETNRKAERAHEAVLGLRDEVAEGGKRRKTTRDPLPKYELNTPIDVIYLQNRDRSIFKDPPKSGVPEHMKNRNRYCQFHKDFGHDTVHCRNLYAQVMLAIHAGRLGQYVKNDETRPRPDTARTEKGKQVQASGSEEQTLRVVPIIIPREENQRADALAKNALIGGTDESIEVMLAIHAGRLGQYVKNEETRPRPDTARTEKGKQVQASGSEEQTLRVVPTIVGRPDLTDNQEENQRRLKKAEGRAKRWKGMGHSVNNVISENDHISAAPIVFTQQDLTTDRLPAYMRQVEEEFDGPQSTIEELAAIEAIGGGENQAAVAQKRSQKSRPVMV